MLELEVLDLDPHVGEGLDDFPLALVVHVEEHVPAAPRAHHAPADRPVRHRGVVDLVYPLGREALDCLLLFLERLRDEGRKLVEVARDHGVLHLPRVVPEVVVDPADLVLRCHVAVDLLVEDAVRQAALARVRQHEVVMELVEDVRLDSQGVDDDGPVLAELHEVEPAKDRGELVLVPALDAEVLPLDVIREISNLVVSVGDAVILGEGANEGHAHGRGGPEAGPRWHVAVDEYVASLADEGVPLAHGLDGSLDEVEVAVVREVFLAPEAGNHIVILGLDGELRVLAGDNRHISILVDGGVKHDAAAFLGIGCNVRAPAAEFEPEGGFTTNDHKIAPPDFHLYFFLSFLINF